MKMSTVCTKSLKIHSDRNTSARERIVSGFWDNTGAECRQESSSQPLKLIDGLLEQRLFQVVGLLTPRTSKIVTMPSARISETKSGFYFTRKVSFFVALITTRDSEKTE